MSREDDERREVRRERHLRRLESRHPRCPTCGEKEPAALIRNGARLLCYECHFRAVGRRPFERHHLAGRQNARETKRLPANVHHAVTDEQRDWPEETWRNPRGSELIRDAAWIRALIDNERLILDRLQSVVEDLELIDEALTARFGEAWRQELGLPETR